MDLITTGVSASERMRRENLVSLTRNIIMEKLQLGGPSTRVLEVRQNLDMFLVNLMFSILTVTKSYIVGKHSLQLLEELKKQSSGTEYHLSDVSLQLCL